MPILFTSGLTRVVGSFAHAADMAVVELAAVAADCDLVEIRLDLLAAGGGEPLQERAWRRMTGLPLLFTARRRSEGGAMEWSAAERERMLTAVIDEAGLIDIEVASIPEMAALIQDLVAAGTPWVASFHDFTALPANDTLEAAAARARDAGAAAFKLAARLGGPADVARLADFQLTDHGLPVATMGMGPLAPVSRLLCAQCGSVLNYGFIGDTPTAPGQWDAGTLKRAIAALPPLPAGNTAGSI